MSVPLSNYSMSESVLPTTSPKVDRESEPLTASMGWFETFQAAVEDPGFDFLTLFNFNAMLVHIGVAVFVGGGLLIIGPIWADSTTSFIWHPRQ